MDRYFAYGSNMNPRRVRERGLHVVNAEPARLEGFRLQFDKHAREHEGTGHANVVYAPGEVVEGVLYRLAGAAEIEKMDPFERAPINYSREVVEVATAAGRIATWTYFANPAVRRPGLKPRRSYMNHLLAGGAFLSPEYLDRLRVWECIEGC